MPLKPFLNPWPTPKEEMRFVSNIPRSEHDFICGITPGKGPKQTIVNIILEKVIHEYKRRGWDNSSHRESAEQFVANCELVMPGDTVKVSQQYIDGGIRTREFDGNFVSGVAVAELVPHPSTPPLAGGTTGNGATPPCSPSEFHHVQGLRRVAKRPGRPRKVAVGVGPKGEQGDRPERRER